MINIGVANLKERRKGKGGDQCARGQPTKVKHWQNTSLTFMIVTWMVANRKGNNHTVPTNLINKKIE